MHRAWYGGLRLLKARRPSPITGSCNRTRSVGRMSGGGYVVRRGASGPPLTYRPFDNAAHGLEPDFRLLDLADMKG